MAVTQKEALGIWLASRPVAEQVGLAKDTDEMVSAE